MTPGWWNKAASTSIRGRSFWRCIESGFAATALESGPIFLEGGRYNTPRLFSAVYFSENKGLARQEKTQGRGIFEDLTDLSFRVAADLEVPDLTDPGLLAKLQKDFGVGIGELTAPGITAYQRTRPIGQAAFAAGLPGLLVPSSHPAPKGEGDWRNLVVFPSNFVARWIVRT